MKIKDVFDSYDPSDDTPTIYNKSCNRCGQSGLGWMDEKF